MRPSTRRWETRRHSLEEESDLCAIVPALAVRRFTAYGCRMVKSGPFRYDENQCGEPRRRLRRITALRNGSEPFPCRSEEHTSELQSLMRISYAVFCLKKKSN